MRTVKKLFPFLSVICKILSRREHAEVNINTKKSLQLDFLQHEGIFESSLFKQINRGNNDRHCEHVNQEGTYDRNDQVCFS